MAARVTATEVKEIMDNCTIDDTVIDAFIAAGTLVIDQVFVDDTTLGDDLLKEIERWFVAHLVASTVHRMASSEKVGDATIAYTGQWGKKLDATPYGQMVLILDTTGLLSRTGKESASITAIESFDD